jgi:hypothetical protein
MTDSGLAVTVMGNHEFNAIAMHTEKPGGGPLRAHSEKNLKNTSDTREAFAGRDDEWDGWIDWFKTLPLWLDLGELRAVHACWDDASIAVVGDRDLRDMEFLLAAGTKGTPEYEAIEVLLKGPEMPLPEGESFKDKDGVVRHDVRVRWWGNGDATGLTLGEVTMPPGSSDNPDRVAPEALAAMPNYPPEAPPVFFGHYWLPADSPKAPLAPNVVCLDYSAGEDGHVVTYRWDGVALVSADKMLPTPLSSIAKQFAYYDDWKSEPLECPKCGWKGTFEEGGVEAHRELMDSSCPRCPGPLGVLTKSLVVSQPVDLEQ